MTIGPGFENLGEVRTRSEIFSDQLAQTIAGLLGFNFTALHPVGDPLSIAFKSNKK
jgi:hypothetical protein